MTPIAKPNYTVTVTANAVTDVVSLPEKINTSPGTWYAAMTLADFFFFFFHPCYKELYVWNTGDALGCLLTLPFLVIKVSGKLQHANPSKTKVVQK